MILTCADQESFASGGPTLTSFFYEEREEEGIQIAIKADAILMAFHWRADDGPTLNAGWVAL